MGRAKTDECGLRRWTPGIIHGKVIGADDEAGAKGWWEGDVYVCVCVCARSRAVNY